MSNHTPGPWHVAWTNIRCNPDEDDYGTIVATMESSRSPDETKVNARLIASAPDLLAYKNYIEANLERIERGGWTPICFDEFLMSEERETYSKTGGAK